MDLRFDSDGTGAPNETKIKPGTSVSKVSWLEGFVNDLLEPAMRARRARAVTGITRHA